VGYLTCIVGYLSCSMKYLPCLHIYFKFTMPCKMLPCIMIRVPYPGMHLPCPMIHVSCPRINLICDMGHLPCNTIHSPCPHTLLLCAFGIFTMSTYTFTLPYGNVTISWRYYHVHRYICHAMGDFHVIWYLSWGHAHCHVGHLPCLDKFVSCPKCIVND
jgi:hypothetical protein